MTDQEQQIADYQLRLIRIVKGCSRLIDEHDSLRADLLKLVRPVLGPDAEDTELHIYLPQFVVQ